ncbi:MAG: iron ABC transporter permease [Clostridia bacterium]|nr:iron ABC transporter permease [Clostridia bacterium]
MRVLCGFAVFVLLASVLLGVLLGATQVSLSEIVNALFLKKTETAGERIVLYVRLPRVLASLFCGAALSVSGAVIQGVLANRLASPSVIGVNAGAALAVTFCGAFGILGGISLSLFAFLGAFLSVMLINLGAHRWGSSRGTVILMGVALNSLLGAISDTVITVFPDVAITHSDFRIGDFSSVTDTRLIPAVIVITAALLLSFSLSASLDVLSLGEERAQHLGMNTSLMRCLLLTVAALLAGAAVSIAGLLSFVGLLVPHAVRRLSDGSARIHLPLCAILGGAFVTICDTLSRILFAPYEIPVGVIMAFFGAPFFLFILIKGKEVHDRD